MHILVSDTSVLIDLNRAGPREIMCRCGHRLVIPDLTYAQELVDEDGPAWCASGLEVLELTEEETATAQIHFLARQGLSLPDSFGLSLAQRRDWILVAGDGALRRAAETNGVRCHGLLWLVDLMVEAGEDRAVIANGLETVLKHTRCRLPRASVEERIRTLRGH